MMSSSDEGEDELWSGLPPPSTGPKMERCMLGKEEILLPEVMVEQSHIFKDVVGVDTWKTVLTEEQRNHLMQFLPKFPENEKQEREVTVKKLLEGDNFKFGNPLTDLHAKIKDGFCSPDIAKYSSLCRSVKYREYKYRQQRRYTNMLKDMLEARQHVFEQLRKIPPDGHLKFEYNPPPQPKKSTVETRVKKTYVRLMKEVREECGVEDTSSEEEVEEETAGSSFKSKKQLFNTLCPIPSPEPTIPSVFHTFSAKPAINGDIATEGHSSQHKRLRPFSPVEVTEEDFKVMLKNHKRQRLEGEEEYPQLDTSNITLEDIMERCQAIQHSPKQTPETESSTQVINKKKKIKLKEKTEKKLKKSLKEKKVPKDKNASLYNEDGSVSMSESFLDEKEENVLDFPLPETYPPKMTFGQHANFFSLLRDFILEFNDGKATTAKVEEKVREWQESPTSSLNVWYGLQRNWVDSVHQALKFLAGDLIGVMPENFVPYLDFKDRVQQWRWIGAGRDSDEKMGQLFKHWLTNKKEGSGDASEGGQGSPPPPRVRTTYVVQATSEEEKTLFREQEAQRFENPHKGFTYRMHGYESVVGPVKGVYTKDNAMNKAREHALLVSSRPSYVTILTLVRDAAARLPNGEGTRGDICELLKDSQFLAPGVSDAQLNVVVSGALDRLHSEKDPCVKYDVNRKLWIYLHRSRSEEEFERIHQAHGAAQKAKKSLQKPKAAKMPKLKDIKDPPSSTTATPTLKSALTSSSENIAEELISQSHTPGSPSVMPSPKTAAGSPTISQISPRAAVASPRSTANQATLAALKNAVAAGTIVTQSTTSVSQASATIRLQLQQLQQQQQQLQQQQLQQQQQQKQTVVSTAAGVAKLSVPSPAASPSVIQGAQQLPTADASSAQKAVSLGLLQNIRVSNPNLTISQANIQNLTSAIRQELLVQRQNSRGSSVVQSSPVATPTSSAPAVTKVITPLTLTQALNSASSATSTTASSAQLVTRLVQQVSGNQMMSVSNLLAAQRAQSQGARGASPAIKIQGGSLVQAVGGNPVQLTGKPLSQARGQLVQIGGKGAQQVGLIQAPQGGLPTINIIPQGGAAAGVMTLGQPRTPTATADRVGSPSQNVITTTTVRPSQNAVLSTSSPKVVTPSQGGIVVTQLPPGLTLRQGPLPTSTQAKIVTAGQAGLLPTQFIVQQTSGGVSTISTTVSQSLAGGVPLLVSASGGKPGQNIQVVRTVLGQQAGIKPGQATILISQPTLPSNASVLHTGQVLQNTTKVPTKGVQQAKSQPVFARIISPPPTQKVATVGGVSAANQKVPAQVLQTVNKLIAVSASGKPASPVSVIAAQGQSNVTETDNVTVNVETDSDGKS